MSTIRSALVTGGAGFIGHHLVRGLAARGCRTRVLDDLSRGDRSRLADLGDSIEFIHGSVLDPKSVEAAVRGVDVVFHEAAWVSVPHSVEFPLDYHTIDATGTVNVLEAARRAGVRRFIYAASSSAYGDGPELPKRETMLCEPISPYAAAKYAGELYVTVYAKVYGMQTLSLRYFNVFGPHQDPKSLYGAAVPAIVTRMLRGEPPTIYGDGEQTRDFCYVDNVVSANRLAAEAPSVSGEVVNVACGERVTVNDIVRVTNAYLGTKVEPKHEPPRAGDVRDSVADISAAAQLIGYRPLVRFEEGLRRCIDWYRSRMG